MENKYFYRKESYIIIVNDNIIYLIIYIFFKKQKRQVFYSILNCFPFHEIKDGYDFVVFLYFQIDKPIQTIMILLKYKICLSLKQ